MELKILTDKSYCIGTGNTVQGYFVNVDNFIYKFHWGKVISIKVSDLAEEGSYFLTNDL